MKNTTLIEHLLGTTDTPYLLALLLFAAIGVVISLLIHATNRDKDKKFDISVLLHDNWKRILLDFILILVTLRFSNEIVGLQLNEFTALLVGMSYDKVSELLRNKNILLNQGSK